LTLANGQVSAAARNGSLESDPSIIIFALDREQTGSMESVVERSVVALTEWIQISSESIRQQLGDLRYDSDVRPEGLKVDLVRGYTIKVDGTLREDTPE
jgi:hypothetical protein